MDLRINQDQNLCHVIELPSKLPTDFCFNGGIPLDAKVVDWFNPIEIDKFYSSDFIILEGTELIELRQRLREFVAQKRYIKTGCLYVIIMAYGDIFSL